MPAAYEEVIGQNWTDLLREGDDSMQEGGEQEQQEQAVPDQRGPWKPK